MSKIISFRKKFNMIHTPTHFIHLSLNKITFIKRREKKKNERKREGERERERKKKKNRDKIPFLKIDAPSLFQFKIKFKKIEKNIKILKK